MVDTSSQWFALVHAAPIPELGERVNVALLVGSGRGADLHFVPGLPRLAGLATAAERRAVESVLESTRDWLALGKSLSDIAARVGPQLGLSPPMRLYVKLGRDELAALKSSYLEAGGRESGPMRETRARWRAERRIDELLGGALPAVGVKLLRRATPKQLYPEADERVFHAPVPAIARAVRFETRDYLVDGVLVAPGHVDAAVKVATSRIDRAFWHYRTAKEGLLKEYGRRVVTVGVLFDGSWSSSREVAEAVEYVRHIWGFHADHIVDGIRPVQAAALHRLISVGEVP